MVGGTDRCLKSGAKLNCFIHMPRVNHVHNPKYLTGHMINLTFETGLVVYQFFFSLSCDITNGMPCRT